jgi:hypothetical protein
VNSTIKATLPISDRTVVANFRKIHFAQDAFLAVRGCQGGRFHIRLVLAKIKRVLIGSIAVFFLDDTAAKTTKLEIYAYGH